MFEVLLPRDVFIFFSFLEESIDFLRICQGIGIIGEVLGKEEVCALHHHGFLQNRRALQGVQVGVMRRTVMLMMTLVGLIFAVVTFQ